MATATFFGSSELRSGLLTPPEHVAVDVNNNTVAAAPPLSKVGDTAGEGGPSLDTLASLPFPWKASFVQQTHLVGEPGGGPGHDIAGGDAVHKGGRGGGSLQYCHLAFHAPVIAPPSSVVLGSRLDNVSNPVGKTQASARSTEACGTGLAGATSEHCRIAFHGRLVVLAGDANGVRKAPGDAGSALEFGTQAGQLKLFTEKSKTGAVFRVAAQGHGGGGAVDVFGKDLFKKQTDMSPFVGMLVQTEVRALAVATRVFEENKSPHFEIVLPEDAIFNFLSRADCSSHRARQPSRGGHGNLRPCFFAHGHTQIFSRLVYGRMLTLVYDGLDISQGGVVGKIEAGFGKAGRFKAHFPAGTSIKVNWDK